MEIGKRKKYRKEVTQTLVKKQQEYGKRKAGNDCESCGETNEGSLIEIKPGIL